MLHPVMYVSKTLNDAQRNYSATKKEALALVFALEQFRHIILSYPVQVYTDHKPLLGALKHTTKDSCLKSWSLLVQEYAVNIHYIKGKQNLFADALSRLPDIHNSAEDLDDQLHNELIERNELCKKLNEYIPEKVPWGETELRNAQKKKNCMH